MDYSRMQKIQEKYYASSMKHSHLGYVSQLKNTLMIMNTYKKTGKVYAKNYQLLLKVSYA
jgi:hypothetical protein